MLYLRKTMSLAVAALLLAQSLLGLFTKDTPTEPTAPPEPDIISAIHTDTGEEKLNLLMIDDAIPAGAKLG